MLYRSPCISLVILLLSILKAYTLEKHPNVGVRFVILANTLEVVFEVPPETTFKITQTNDRSKIFVEFENLGLNPAQKVYWFGNPVIQEIRFIDAPTKLMAEVTLNKAFSVKNYFRSSNPPCIVIEIADNPSGSLDVIKTPDAQDTSKKLKKITNSEEGSETNPYQPQLDYGKYFTNRDNDNPIASDGNGLNHAVVNTNGSYPIQNGGFFVVNVSQFDQRVNSNRFLGNVERWGFLNFSITPFKLGDGLVGEGEMIYSPYQNFDHMEGFREYQPMLFRFGLKGSWGRFDYGVEYLDVRNGVDKVIGRKIKSDQEGSSLWLKRAIGAFNITAFFSEFSENVAENPVQPRVKKTQGGIKMDVVVPDWPYLIIHYSHGDSRSLSEPRRFRSIRNWQDNLGATLYYGRTNWDISASSTSTISSEGFLSGSNSVALFYELSGSYRPNQSFTVTPALSLRDERFQLPGGGARYITPTASLWFTYRPLSEDFNFTMYGSHSMNKGNDGYTDTNVLNGTISLVWTLAKSPFGRHSMSLDFSYYHYLNDKYDNTSYKDVSALLNLKLASF